MSNPPDRPWTEEEKNCLLTEILKKDGISSSHLFRLIRDNNILPRWTEIPLPAGRSLSSCQMAFNQMHQSHAPDQRALQPFRPDPSSQAHISPYQAPSSLSRKRPIPPLEPLHRSTPSTPRAIQPRPPTSAGGRFNGSSSVDSSTQAVQISPGVDTSIEERPRKRGRPSKLETQRRIAEAQAKGEEYPPPKRKSGTKSKTNRQTGSSPRTTTMGEAGGDSQGNRFSATTSRLQTAIEMDAPPRAGTLPRESPSSSNRRRLEQQHIDRPTEHQSADPQNLRPDPTIGSSPRSRLGGSMYPPADQIMGGTRVLGQDEPGGGSAGGGGGGSGGGGPLSTPRTILASQMSAQPASSSYAPSFRGINEMGAPPNTSVAQGMGGISPTHRIGQSPSTTMPMPMPGEGHGGGGGQNFQLAPGPGVGTGSGGGGGGGGKTT